MKFPPASKQLIELLNQALEGEMQGIIQYMWQHVLWSGIPGFAVKDELRSIAMQEMGHAEVIAERFQYMGGVPPITPNPVTLGNDLSKMLALDVQLEEKTIILYRQIIQVAASEGDNVTQLLFEKILGDEEDHHNTFTTLVEVGQPSAINNLMVSLKNLSQKG
jgi:bacterioferritin